MRTRFHRNKKRYFSLFIILALVLVFFVYKNFLANVILDLTRPLFKYANFLNEWQESDVEKLNQQIEELKNKLVSCQAVEKQNQELKSLLGRKESRQVVAGVLMRPPQTPYDALIIDLGSRDGVQRGMRVRAYGDILIGFIDEVYSKTSKVKMISFPEEETNVYLLNSKISAIAKGRGGGEMEIILPRSFEIKTGEIITTLEMDSLMVGLVERIEYDLTDPFQKIIFRLPFNIQELRYVVVDYE